MKHLFWIIVVVAAALVVAVTVCDPNFLAQNEFLKGFINHELLNILAVMATVTIASAANIHLSFNRLEEKAGELGLFSDARREINSSALALVWLFLITIVFLFVRSIDESVRWVSFWNGACLVVLLTNVLVLVDITLAVFEIYPLESHDQSEES